jgi:hypothetical protein
MLVGIVPFIVFYTVVASTPWFSRLCAAPFVRRTLYIGFGVRLAISVISPVGTFADYLSGKFSFEMIASHMPSGFISVGPGTQVLFGATLLITILQGVMLNLILFTFMGVVWGIQAVKCKWPDSAPRGFPIEANQAK